MNVAVVGTSFISTTIIKACRESAAFNVKAVVSRDEQKGRALCDMNQVDTLYTDFANCLKDHEINVVYLASPNDMHFSQSQLALMSGKDVISEKPLVSRLLKACGIKLINDADPSKAYLTLESLKALEKVADGQSTKIIVPSELQGLASILGSAKALLDDSDVKPAKAKAKSE